MGTAVTELMQLVRTTERNLFLEWGSNFGAELIKKRRYLEHLRSCDEVSEGVVNSWLEFRVRHWEARIQESIFVCQDFRVGYRKGLTGLWKFKGRYG